MKVWQLLNGLILDFKPFYTITGKQRDAAKFYDSK